MSSDLTDEDLKLAIVTFILKKGRWGAHDYPIDTMGNWIGKKVRRNGKRVRQTIKKLVNEGYLIVHKRGDTISLNPARSKEIMELLSRAPQ
ncbi:MAG: hypothetical protein HY619_07725 [Thaumarchaeota archaeon]|nr:hypothetical protein [Nitrososphaerota archaeon]